MVEENEYIIIRCTCPNFVVSLIRFSCLLVIIWLALHTMGYTKPKFDDLILKFVLPFACITALYSIAIGGEACKEEDIKDNDDEDEESN